MEGRTDQPEASSHPSSSPGATWLRAAREVVEPLSLADLDVVPRRLVTAGAVALALAVGLVVVGGWSAQPPGGLLAIKTPALSMPALPVPVLVVIAIHLGLGVASALFVVASVQPGWRLPRLTRAAVGVLGALTAGLAAHGLLFISAVANPSGGAAARLLVSVAFTWLGVLGGLATALLADRTLRARSLRAAALAALPYLVIPLCMAAAGSSLPVAPALNAALNVDRVVPAAWVPGALLLLLRALVEVVLGLVLLWIAVAGLRAVRDVSIDRSRLLPEDQRWVLLVVGVKLAVAAFGAGLLGNAVSPGWRSLRADGPVEWALAAAYAGACCLWLLRLRPSTGSSAAADRGFVAAIVIVLGGWVSGFLVLLALGLLASLDAAFLNDVGSLVAAVLLLAAARWLAISGRAGAIVAAVAVLSATLSAWLWYPRPTASRATATLTGLSTLVEPLALQLLFALLALPLAVVAWLVPRWRPTAPYLLLFAAWIAPKAISIVLDSERGFVDLLTLDVMMSLGIGLLAVGALLGWWSVPAGSLLVVVCASAAVALLPALLPPLPTEGRGLLLVLGAALVWQFVIDASDLNKPGATRPAKVLGTLGLALAGFVLAALPATAGVEKFGGFLVFVIPIFTVPFVALLLANRLRTPAWGLR